MPEYKLVKSPLLDVREEEEKEYREDIGRIQRLTKIQRVLNIVIIAMVILLLVLLFAQLRKTETAATEVGAVALGSTVAVAECTLEQAESLQEFGATEQNSTVRDFYAEGGPVEELAFLFAETLEKPELDRIIELYEATYEVQTVNELILPDEGVLRNQLGECPSLPQLGK